MRRGTLIAVVLAVFLAAVVVFVLSEKLCVPTESENSEYESQASEISRESSERSRSDIQSSASEPEQDESRSDYRSPKDFAALSEEYPDICGWLDIPGTDISHPIVRHESDDGFYMDHAPDGKKSADGAIFIEKEFNSKDFTDTVTVIYGHNRMNKKMFSGLQKHFSGTDFLEKKGEIVIYMPDRELHFRAFAAVPWNKWHILYNYDFVTEAGYERFTENVKSVRALGAVMNEEFFPENGEQLIILSTCLKGSTDKRYIVCAKLMEIIK